MNPPARLLVLLAASDWGIPPWTILGEEPGHWVRVKWFLMWKQAFRLGGIGWGNKVKGLGL